MLETARDEPEASWDQVEIDDCRLVQGRLQAVLAAHSHEISYARLTRAFPSLISAFGVDLDPDTSASRPRCSFDDEPPITASYIVDNIPRAYVQHLESDAHRLLRARPQLLPRSQHLL